MRSREISPLELDNDAYLSYLALMSHPAHPTYLPREDSTIAHSANYSTHSLAAILLFIAFANVMVAQDVASLFATGLPLREARFA
jgi:hypothetical protein